METMIIVGTVEQVWADEESIEYEAEARGYVASANSYHDALRRLEVRLSKVYGYPVQVEDAHEL